MQKTAGTPATPAGTYDWENAGPARFGQGLEALGAIFLCALYPILWLLGAGSRSARSVHEAESELDSTDESLSSDTWDWEDSWQDDSPSPDGTGFSWQGDVFVMHSDYGR